MTEITAAGKSLFALPNIALLKDISHPGGAMMIAVRYCEAEVKAEVKAEAKTIENK